MLPPARFTSIQPSSVQLRFGDRVATSAVLFQASSSSDCDRCVSFTSQPPVYVCHLRSAFTITCSSSRLAQHFRQSWHQNCICHSRLWWQADFCVDQHSGTWPRVIDLKTSSSHNDQRLLFLHSLAITHRIYLASSGHLWSKQEASPSCVSFRAASVLLSFCTYQGCSIRCKVLIRYPWVEFLLHMLANVELSLFRGIVPFLFSDLWLQGSLVKLTEKRRTCYLHKTRLRTTELRTPGRDIRQRVW